MKIAVVNNFFPPRPGGSSHLAESLAIQYAKAGHEVLVLTASYGDAPAREERDGLTIVRLPSWTLPKTPLSANFDIAFTLGPRTKRRVFGLLDEFRPDVVHQHGQFFDLTWYSGWWARKRRIPTLLSVHTRLYSPSKLNNMIFRMGDAMVVKPMLRVHHPDLVVMDALMDEYIDGRYRGAYSNKHFIPVGIDPDALRGGDAKHGRELVGLADDEQIILSIGHVIPQRNRLPLIEALPTVLKSYPKLKVVVVGGVYNDDFLKRAEELGVRDAVLALGARPKKEIPDYLAASRLEVHELDGQGFGTASLEALAVGVPVVAGVHPDNFVEVKLEDGKHLFMTPFLPNDPSQADPVGLAQALIHVLGLSEEERATLSTNAQEVVESHFTIAKVASAHLEAFDQMIESNKQEHSK